MPDPLIGVVQFSRSVQAVLVSPGDLDQVAVAKFLLHEVGYVVPVGVSRQDRKQCSATAFHRELLAEHGWPLSMPPDGLGVDIIRDVLRVAPGTPCFTCAPMDTVGALLKQGGHIREMTIQGGFAPYTLHRPTIRLAKFEGQEAVPSFNLNGNPGAAHRVLSAPGTSRRLVGKNVCHTVEYSRVTHERILSFPAANAAMSLLRNAMSLYLERHGAKKFHDPVAAVCHVHPEIGTWTRGRSYKTSGKWGTHSDPAGDQVLVDLDRDAFWQHIATGA